jgi:anhydro-N-acetylmuramic acid kinase
LLDLEAGRLSGGAQSCDLDGQLALAGRVREDLLSRLLADPYYALPPPKSTGRETYDTEYVARQLEGLPEVSGRDLLATLTELTARTVAQACRRHGVREVVASGGGVRNPALVAALRRALDPATLIMAEARGLPADGKEAYLFALLGFLSWHGLPGAVPGATGARGARILGRVSPGAGPLLMQPAATAPTRLVWAEN